MVHKLFLFFRSFSSENFSLSIFNTFFLQAMIKQNLEGKPVYEFCPKYHDIYKTFGDIFSEQLDAATEHFVGLDSALKNSPIFLQQLKDAEQKYAAENIVKSWEKTRQKPINKIGGF